MTGAEIQGWLLAVAPYVAIGIPAWLSLRNRGVLRETKDAVSSVKADLAEVKHLTNGNIAVITKLAERHADDRVAQAFSAGQDEGRPHDPALTKAIATEAVKVATDAAATHRDPIP